MHFFLSFFSLLLIFSLDSFFLSYMYTACTVHLLWFNFILGSINFYFPLFFTHYCTLPYTKTLRKENKNGTKDKIEPQHIHLFLLLCNCQTVICLSTYLLLVDCSDKVFFGFSLLALLGPFQKCRIHQQFLMNLKMNVR